MYIQYIIIDIVTECSVPMTATAAPAASRLAASDILQGRSEISTELYTYLEMSIREPDYMYTVGEVQDLMSVCEHPL